MDKKTAGSRWLTLDGQSRSSAIISALQEGPVSERHLLNYTFLTEDSLIDLRGLSFGLGMDFNRIPFRNLDLSYSTFAGSRFKYCTFENVLFKEIRSGGWIERGCQFIDVNFEKSELRHAGIGLDCSVYNRVNFTRVDFSGSSFYCAQFMDCNFSDAKLNGIDFNACNFINCKFRGRLESVWFRRYYPHLNDETRFGNGPPNEMHNVDFSEAELWDVTFTGGLDLSKVMLPQDGSHILLHHFDDVLSKIRGVVGGLSWSYKDKEQAKITVDSFLVHAQNQPMWIINKNEILEEMGKQLGAELTKMLEDFDTDTNCQGS